MSWEKLVKPSNIFLSFLVFFLCGAGARSLFDFDAQSLLLACFFVLLIVATVLPLRKLVFLFFCLFGLSLGVWRTETEIAKMDLVEDELFFGQAIVSRVPEKRQSYQIVTLRPVEGEKRNFNWKADEFQALAGSENNFRYGEILQVSCQLQQPENKYDSFNYQRFLAGRKIFRVCKKAQIEKTGQREGNIVLKGVFAFREGLEQRIDSLLPLPESAYLAGLLLGGSERLPEDVAEQFQKTGMTHVVAASGYNITILASAVIFLAILFGMWRQHAFWLALLGIVFFVLMIGAPASATRAAVMGSLVLWAAKKGRLASSFRAVVFAGAVMVFHAPMSLVHDAGLQLSFLATVGIISIYGPLSQKFNIKEDFLELKSIVLVSISAQLGVLGIIVFSFNSFSPISLFANLVILPLVPFIMLGGFCMVLASLFSPFLAKILSAAVWASLHLEIKAVEMLSEVPWASLPIENIHWSWLLGYYIFFALLAMQLRKRTLTVP